MLGASAARTRVAPGYAAPGRAEPPRRLPLALALDGLRPGPGV